MTTMEQAEVIVTRLITAYETSGVTRALITAGAIDGVAKGLGCTMLYRDMYMVIFHMESRNYVFTHMPSTKVYAMARKDILFADAVPINFEADDGWETSGHAVRPKGDANGPFLDPD